MRYALHTLGAIIIVFGIGLAIGFATLDLNYAGALRFSNLADAYFYYDESGNQMPAYEDPSTQLVFPEDQNMPPPSDPSQWNWVSPEDQVVQVVDTNPPDWVFNGPNDLTGTPVDYYYNDQAPPDYNNYYDYYSPQYVSDPWYVTAFPGIGRVAQYIIPGQAPPVVQPAPIVQPIVQPVQQRPVYPQPSCWISAQPTLVSPGGTTVLSWSSFNATQAALSGFGNVSVSGSRTVSGITSGQAYTLAVSGPGGNGSCYTRVNVVQQVSGQPSCIISAHPDVVLQGESTSLAWGSQNSSSAFLSGFGSVNVQGGTTVTPQQSNTYTLTVFGSSNQSSQCSARVTVQ